MTRIAKERGWLVVHRNFDQNDRILQNCNVYWVDTSKLAEVISWIEPWVKVNHFPGMNELVGRKAGLAQHLRRMQKLLPLEYDFFPPTWVLPYDIAAFKASFAKDGMSRNPFIVKPDRGSRGRGIFISHDYERIRTATQDEVMVAQKYIADPLLIDDMKFDLRLYLLVGAVIQPETGSLELRIFLMRDGLVRLCTTKFKPPTHENEDEHRMHLTNYAVNKNADNFEANIDASNDGAGSKRSLRWFLADFEDQYGAAKAEQLWNSLCSMCVKTILVAQPTLDLEYHSKFPKDLSGCSRQCRSFELLGVDVMIDSKHVPSLIEINCLPSFTTDSPLDEDIKKRAVDQVLDLTCGHISSKDRDRHREIVHRRRCGESVAPDTVTGYGAGATSEPLDQPAYKDFVRIYPPRDEAEAAKYEGILERACCLFSGRRASVPKAGNKPSQRR